MGNWLRILHLLLWLFVERGKSKPARLEKEANEKYQEAMAEDDFTTASILLRDCIKRVLRAKDRSTAR